jgi:hypothetical protein
LHATSGKQFRNKINDRQRAKNGIWRIVYGKKETLDIIEKVVSVESKGNPP